MSSTIRPVPPSPTTDVHIATWQFETSAGAPQLAFKELTPLAMDGTILSKSPINSISSPNLYNKTTSRPHTSTGAESPSPSPFMHNTNSSATPRQPFARRTSSSLNYTISSMTTPSRPALPISPQSSPQSPNDSPTSAADCTPIGSPSNNAFSSAIGRATLGKSGRVIERLMSDIDRLKRELQLETTRRQEIERREEATKQTLARLQTEVANLERAKDVDDAALSRRDRKIEELKADLEKETSRREKAEIEAKMATNAAHEKMKDCQAKVGMAVERRRQVEREMSVLEDAHKGMRDLYQTRTAELEKVFGQVLEEKEEELAKVRRLDVVCEQMGQELERANRANEGLRVAFERYREVKEEEVERIKKEARMRDEEDGATREETRKVLEEARWLLTLGKKNIEEAKKVPIP